MFNLSSPKGKKPYLRLRITQFDIFVLNFTFYQYFPGKDQRLYFLPFLELFSRTVNRIHVSR